jgi:hypothetical protein
VASQRPDLSGADVLLHDEDERDALRDRHTEWSRITLGGRTGCPTASTTEALRPGSVYVCSRSELAAWSLDRSTGRIGLM